MAKPVQLDANGYRKFGARDKWAYAAGDFGCNMSFALKNTMALFWTQFMGIDSITMAALMIFVNVWDAINDPLIGSVIDADRRQYKRNKFLQYIFIGSCGLLVAGALCFLPFPGMPSIVKNIMFVAGYILWDAFYTIANVPYGSILSLISNDASERAQLSTFRSLGSYGGGILTMVLLPFLIYDAADNLIGERVFIIALIMGVIGFFSFRFMIKNTVIRVEQNITVTDEQEKVNIFKGFFKSFGHFIRNRAAVGATIAPVFQFIAISGITTANQVLFQAYFHNAQISGLVSMLAMVGLFVYMPFVPKIVKRFGKKEAASAGFCVSILAYILMLVLPITPDMKGVAVFVGCQILATFGTGIYSCISWSLMADAMDYEEWKFGTRNEGTTYALHSFFRKLAQGIGPSLCLVLITMLGYDESLKAAQTFETALNIRYFVAASYLFATIMQLVGIGLVFNLDKKKMAQIQTDLEERRAAK